MLRSVVTITVLSGNLFPLILRQFGTYLAPTKMVEIPHVDAER